MSINHKRNISIKPALMLSAVENIFGRYRSFDSIEVNNDKLYRIITLLTRAAYPSFKDPYDTKWEDFYIPLKRQGREIYIPCSITEYKKVYYCFIFKLGNIQVGKGHERYDPLYNTLFKEGIRLINIMRNYGSAFLEQKVPYDFRTGRIQGKYVLPRLMPAEEKEKIARSYHNHLAAVGKAEGCSVQEYLDTATVCYKAVFGRKVCKLSSIEMHKKYADTRHGGMLDIKNWKSKAAFARWYNSNVWSGSHPFEIVFSMINHGIHLYPPESYNGWRYDLRVTNFAYAPYYIKMIKALIRRSVPCIADNLNDELDFLTGESMFTVNEYSDHYFDYVPSKTSKKLYFKHIRWDPLKMLRIKKRLSRQSSMH